MLLDEIYRRCSNRVNLNGAGPGVVAFYVALALIALVSLPQFHYLVSAYWFSEDWISKGPLIWLISIFVIHRDLARQSMRRETDRRDLLLVALSVPLVALASLTEPLLAPTLLLVLAWRLLSPSVDRARLIIVWLFLIFSLPFYSQLVPGLQMITVFVTENFLDLLGVPVLVQEFYIAIPDGQFFVEEGCSGFNYMANNLLLLFLYSLLSRFDLRQFLLGLGVSVAMALIVNWMRVILIILFAHHVGIEHDFVKSHSTFGWFLYAVFLFPYFFLLLKIDRRDERTENTPIASGSPGPIGLPPIAWLAVPLIVTGVLA